MTAATPPTAVTREQFLLAVRASGVLTARQLERAEGSLTPFQTTAREVADHLVRTDCLTRFQAERLLDGRKDGFLLGQYVVTDYLAKADAGRVYKAVHRTMNRAVAVLVLKGELTAGEGVRLGIREQARTAAKLAHPNVLTLLDVNTAGPRMYLVHEYIDGADAGAMVRAGGAMSVPRACEFVRQAAVGLQHAHDKHMLHGRLSPAAVLIGRPGGTGPEHRPVVKVSGLGLGPLGASEPPPEYVAPELAVSTTLTVAADLYALGGVLHLLLTGRPPHPATPIQLVRRDVPPPLAAVVTALLNPDPARRPKSAADVANAMAAFAADDSALIDFSLPPTDPLSAPHITGGASGSTLPCVGPEEEHVPAVWSQLNGTTPAPAVEELQAVLNDVVGDVAEDDTPANGQVVHTPVHTVRRKRKANRTRRDKSKVTLWLGLAAAVGVLLAAGVAVMVLVSLLK